MTDVPGRNGIQALPEMGKARAVWVPWRLPEIKGHSRK